MLRATGIVRKAAVKADKIIDTVTLDHDERQKRRVALKAAGGLDVLVDLDKATMLGDGDALKLEDGRLVGVRAAPEKLLKITAENSLRLTRIAWHIGNRHTPAEITADALYIEADHVLAEMVRGQGGLAEEVWRPFQPERGAYDHGGHAHHDHAHHDHARHDHGHHDHAHHGHEHHDHAHHDHVHGPDCGCGHDHHHHGHAHHHEHLEKPASAHEQAHDHTHHDHAHGHPHGHAHKHGH